MKRNPIVFSKEPIMPDELFRLFSPLRLRQSTSPLYLALYQELASMIQKKQLLPQYRLPPVRRLASFLSINPGTVVAAYRELEQNGYILTRRGSGSYVADREGSSFPMLTIQEEEQELPAGAVDLSRIAIEPSLFPTAALKEVISRIIDRDGAASFSAGDSQGYLPLRQALAEAAALEGIVTDAAHIQIVSGSQQGIDLAAKALLRRGSFVITERPSYPGALSLFHACGAKIADLPLTHDGLDLDALENLVVRFRPSLLYVTPDIQAPTGMTYSIPVKARILALARRYDFYILEDDYASGLFYGTAPKTMKALDSHDRVLYLRSISSLFADGLRLAFLIMPGALSATIRKVKYLSDIATAGLTQRVLDVYLRDGLWAPYVEKVRARSGEKLQDALAAARLAPSVQAAVPKGGLSLWLTLPEGVSASSVVAAARKEGFLFRSGAPFYPRQDPDRHIRLSFGQAAAPDLRQAFALLEKLVSST